MHQRGKSFSGREPHCVFLNTRDRRFANISATSGLDFTDDGRAVAIVDWDHDGDLDLWIANRTAPQVRFLRNDTPTSHHFLTLRLQGTTSNRDAIGARVAVYPRAEGGKPELPLLRSLRAGEGFLSQSSKWLHFGLGPAREIDRVVVHWPAGESETFSGLEADRRFWLRQGSGVAAAATPRRRRVALGSKELRTPFPRTPERASLVSRPPLPVLDYRDLEGRERQFERERRGATLVNLWATWCSPCHAELRELTRRADELRARGLDVLALSVDGLDETKGTTPALVEPFLRELGFPFGAGLADPVLLSKLQVLLDAIFYRHLAIAVPMSFLVDTQGRLATLYRGPVDIARLLQDVDALGSDPGARRAMASPFAGRWFGSPQGLSFTTLAQSFVDEGFPADAIVYLEEMVRAGQADAGTHAFLGDLRHLQGDPEGAHRSYEQALRLDPSQLGAGRGLADLLASEGRASEALVYYERAVEVAPGIASSRYNLGNLLQRLGRLEAAAEQYRAALRIDSDLTEAHSDLGTLLAGRGDSAAAIAHLRRALELGDDLPQTHNNLGVLLFERGESARAVEHFRRAVELDPDYADARNNLAAARRMSAQRGAAPDTP